MFHLMQVIINDSNGIAVLRMRIVLYLLDQMALLSALWGYPAGAYSNRFGAPANLISLEVRLHPAIQVKRKVLACAKI